MIGKFLVLTLLYSSYAFEMVCPSAEQWYLRAVIKCPSLDQYTCLSDFSDQIYNESCSGPIVALPGERRVNSNKNFDIKPCTFERYQPVTFSSTQGSACLFQKGKCSEEGLLLYNNGTYEMDRTCRCDYTRGFAFMSTHRRDPCSCNAATEDCSCYKKECNESQVLSPDYKCINETQQQSTFLCSFINVISSTESVKNITDDETVNVYVPILPYTQVNRYDAAIFILVMMIAWSTCSVFYILCLHSWKPDCWKQTDKKKFEEFFFIKQLEDQNCFEGGSVTFKCEVNQENIPGRWSKDGQELKPSESISITAVGKVHVLVINSVTANDSGNYSCHIKDEESQSKLTVKEVIFIKQLEDQNWFEGGSVKFTCEVNQENIPGRWSKDEVELKPSESISITAVGKVHILVIHSVTANDSGNYSCHIKDEESQSMLTVKEVIFIKQLEYQKCLEGDIVTFTCEVNQENIPGRWSKDGQELKPSESISITAVGKVHILVIHSVTANDSGNYSCHITNKISSAQLTVSEVIIIKPLEEEQQHIEGDKVTFTCEVNSEILPGKWFKGGQELSCSDYLDITANGRLREIVIHRVTFNDRGYYSFNIAGKTSGGVLVVLDKFTPDKINYIRLYHLLETVAEPVVREIFDREIHPSQLKKILNQNSNKIHHLKLKKHINIREYDLLYPRVVEYSVKFKIKNYDCKRIHQNNEENLKLRAEIECAVSDLYSNVEGHHKVTVVEFESRSLIVVLQLKSSSDENNLRKILRTAVNKGKVGSFETESTEFRFTRLGNVQAASKDFDIRLMMVLMKNLTDLNIADVFPHKDDPTVVADLSRIKYLRNRIVQNSDMSITDEDFDNDWKHLSEAVERLGGGAYEKKCEELKNLNPPLQHVQEYLNSKNLQSNRGEISTDSISDLFLENEVNNLFARDAVRRIFDKQFPPLKLETEIEARRKELEVLKEERKITQSQWEDIFPTDKESLSSSRFDIKMMIILLRSTSFKDKDVFKTIEYLQNHLSIPEYDDRAIKKAIKEINEAA